MRVIITGATGFIGVTLCKEMLDKGYNVTAIVRPNSQKKDRLPKVVNIIELSLDKLNELQGKYDLFYHLAWNGSSGNDRDDFEMQYSNIKYTAEAIRAAKRCGCKKFIGAGSQAEYGLVSGMANEEATVPNPFMMYGAAKLASYSMGKVLSEQLNISFIWARIYSVYGALQNEGTLISYVVKTLKEGRAPELSSCENMWDFMHVSDCASALRVIGEKENSRGLYNISTGKPKLLKQFVKEIRDIVNPNVQLRFGGIKTDMKKSFWLEPDVNKLKKCGFECKYDFKEGLNKYLEGEL